jgi:DNA polymerase-3 subunit gamma/tau
MARLLAMALCCNGNGDDNPAQRDAIWRGEHLDVSELDGASNNSIEDVRELRERCAYAPTNGNYRVFIVDEVHMLSSAAFNGLLKILEEPPAHVVFIFATTEIAKIPATALSRCQRFNFRPIGAEDIVNRLAQIAAAEKVDADLPALEAIARLARGSMRDAQTMFDQLVTFCGGKLRESTVQEMYSLPSAKDLDAIAAALMERDGERAVAIAEKWYGEGVDLHGALLEIQGIVRKTMVERFRGGGECHSTMELLRTLQRHGRNLPHAASELATLSVALLEAIENSRRRPIGDIIEQLSN